MRSQDQVVLKSFSGPNYACRGDTPTDRLDSYFTAHFVDSFLDCKAHCASDDCYGIEYYYPNYCEIWNRPPLATQSVPGYECFVKATLESFQGTGRACRGLNPSDNSPGYYNNVH